jgi:hypothetical protein
MTKTAIFTLVLVLLSSAATWGVGTDNACMVGQNHPCPPPTPCACIGHCMGGHGCGPMDTHWTVRSCQTVSSTTATQSSMSMHCSMNDHSTSIGCHGIRMFSTMSISIGTGHCQPPIVITPCPMPIPMPCPMPWGTGCN